MVPCKVRNTWWMCLLCVFGIHWHGRTDGGVMGDSYQCHVCRRDNYGPCFIVHDETGIRDWDAILTLAGVYVSVIAMLLVSALAIAILVGLKS